MQFYRANSNDACSLTGAQCCVRTYVQTGENVSTESSESKLSIYFIMLIKYYIRHFYSLFGQNKLPFCYTTQRTMTNLPPTTIQSKRNDDGSAEGPLVPWLAECRHETSFNHCFGPKSIREWRRNVVSCVFELQKVLAMASKKFCEGCAGFPTAKGIYLYPVLARNNFIRCIGHR